jgi:transcription initiation factor IIF auxiliary subunit
MDKKQRTLLIQEYGCGGKSYRILARKYGVSLGYISKVIRSNKEYRQKQAELEAAAAAKKTARRKKDDLPDDVQLLKEEIRKLKLKIELQDIIIDISSKETGIDLRKKRGARRSK